MLRLNAVILYHDLLFLADDAGDALKETSPRHVHDQAAQVAHIGQMTSCSMPL